MYYIGINGTLLLQVQHVMNRHAILRCIHHWVCSYSLWHKSCFLTSSWSVVVHIRLFLMHVTY